MAARRRIVRAGAARRRADWINAPFDLNLAGAGGTANVSLSGAYETSRGSSLENCTIRRIVLSYTVTPIAATTGAFYLGIQVRTSAQDPSASKYADWIYWAAHYANAAGSLKYDRDMKGGRRFAEIGDQLFVSGNNQAASNIEVSGFVRCLILLP